MRDANRLAGRYLPAHDARCVRGATALRRPRLVGFCALLVLSPGLRRLGVSPRKIMDDAMTEERIERDMSRKIWSSMTAPTRLPGM